MNKIVVLNQKNSMEYEDITEYIKKIKDNIRRDLDVILCPSDIFIPYFKGKYTFKLGAQNICFTTITGEATGKQLKSVGVSHVIVGHSERKRYLGETNQMINKKIKECLDNVLIPIVCVGETKEEKDRKKTGEVIIKQLKDYFLGVDFSRDIIIAYEPIWAIGTGIIPNNEEIKEVVEVIKNNVFKTYNINVSVIYGGSINDKNINKLNEIKELDGYLLGKASSSKEKTIEILNLVK